MFNITYIHNKFRFHLQNPSNDLQTFIIDTNHASYLHFAFSHQQQAVLIHMSHKIQQQDSIVWVDLLKTMHKTLLIEH